MAFRTTIAAALFLFMFASTAGAGGSIFSGNGIGEQQVGGGIRALGLGGGGLGLRDSMSFNSLNPGLVAFVPRTTMRMGGEIGFWNTTSNGLTDSDGEMTWKDLRLYVPLTSRWKFGAGLEPVFRQDLHTIGTRSANFPTDSADVQDYEERVTWTGSTADVRLDNSYRVSDRLGIGVSAIYTVQHNERNTIIEFADDDYLASRFTQTTTFRGWSFAVGMYGGIGEKLGFGGYYRPSLDGKWTEELTKSETDSVVKRSETRSAPGEFALGLSYKLSPSFTGVADVTVGQWSRGDFGLTNTIEPESPMFVSVGVERLARRTPLYSGFDLWGYRAGLFYRSHYWATATGDPVTDIGLSLGTSIPIAKSSGWLHWAAEVGQRGMDEEKLGATESFFRFSFQVEIGETWFQRRAPRTPQ